MNRPAFETSEPPRFHRKSIRLKGYDYSQAGMYFVTIVSWQRLSLFGEVAEGEMRLNPYGEIVRACWDEIPIHFPNVLADVFVVMPNHVHGVICINDDVATVGARHASPLQTSHALPVQTSHASPVRTMDVDMAGTTHDDEFPSVGATVGATHDDEFPSVGATVGATHALPLQMTPRLRPRSLGAIVGSFKSAASKQINILRGTPGTTIWQRNYYEHIIRNEESLYRICQYIIDNPANWNEDTENPARPAKQDGQP